MAFFKAGDVRIELVEPTAADSPIAKFIEKRGEGIHHIAFETDDINDAIEHVKKHKIRMIDDTPRPGAHSMEIAFMHPKATGGLLLELCQKSSKKDE